MCRYDIEGFIHSQLGTADYAPLVTSSLCYHGSLDTWTVIQMTAAKFKPFTLSIYQGKAEQSTVTFRQYILVSSPLWACDQTLFPVWRLLFCLCGALSGIHSRILTETVCEIQIISVVKLLINNFQVILSLLEISFSGRLYLSQTRLRMSVPVSDKPTRVLTPSFSCGSLSWVEWSLSYGQRSVDQFILVSGSPLGPMTRFYPYRFFSSNCFVVFPVGRPLLREDGSVTYSAIADWSVTEDRHAANL
jgi:hypothetical protein